MIARTALPTLTLWIAALVTLFGGTVQAEQERISDKYMVHYNVINSTFLNPDIASQYNITRGENVGVVIVSVQEIVDTEETVPASAEVSGKTSNLVQSEALEFEEVREQKVRYYVAEFRFENGEPRSYTIDVQPEGVTRSYELNFTDTLYQE